MSLNNIEKNELNINELINSKLEKLDNQNEMASINLEKISDLFSNLDWKNKENLLFVLNNTLDKELESKNINFSATLEKNLNKIETV